MIFSKPAHSLTQNRSRARLAALAVSALVLVAIPASASAAPAGASVIVKVRQTSGLISTYFHLQSHPGRRVKAGFVLLLNPTSRAIIVRVDPVGAITTDTLGSAYALRGGGHGSGAWLKLSPRQVKIAPRSQRRVNVSVTTPRSAKPGDYLSGIAVEALGQDSRAARATHKRGLPPACRSARSTATRSVSSSHCPAAAIPTCTSPVLGSTANRPASCFESRPATTAT